MAENAVAPWKGELEWVGEPNGGQGQNGEWKSVDFTLKYTDHQMNEKHMTFNAFGVDRVNKLLSLPMGTELKVVWWPESSYSQKTERWYSKNQVLSIGLAKPEAKSADTKITAPSYPQQGTSVPGNGYAQIPQPQPPLPAYGDSSDDLPDDNLPF